MSNASESANRIARISNVLTEIDLNCECRSRVRDAIAALDAETFYGRVKFGGSGQINSLQPPVFQLQGGKPVVLWPSAIKQGELKFSN